MFGYCIVEMSGEKITYDNAHSNIGESVLVDGKKGSIVEVAIKVVFDDDPSDYVQVDPDDQEITLVSESGGRRRRTRRGRSRRARRGRSHRRR